MSFDSIPRANSPIAIDTKSLSFRHSFSWSLRLYQHAQKLKRKAIEVPEKKY